MAASRVGFVLVPGLGLDERSSRRLRGRLAATVVPLPGMGLAAPLPPLEVLAASAAPGGRLVELPGAAHMTPQTHPDAVASVMRSL
jgi:pimeloyl-ACP methyl ester carboxylesterase